MSHEEIVERRERSAHRAADRLRGLSDPLRRWMMRAAAPAAVLVLAGAALSGLANKSSPSLEGGPPAGALPLPPLEPTPADESPPPVPTPSPISRIEGSGPFVLFAQRIDEQPPRWFVSIVDVGANPGGFTESAFVTVVEGRLQTFESQGGAVTVVAHFEENNKVRSHVWLFARGSPPTRPLVDEGDYVRSALADPAGRRVAVTRGDRPELWLYPAGGGRGAKVMDVPTPPGEVGPLLPLFWAGGELFTVPVCDCEGGDADAFFSLSLVSRRARALRWLGSPSRVRGLSPSADGRTVAFVSHTITDCLGTSSEHGPCFGPPSGLLRAATGRDAVRMLAASDELLFNTPAASAAGRLVAYATGRNEEIAVRDLASGRLLATHEERLLDFAPLDWLGNDLLLVSGSIADFGESEGDEQQTVFVLEFDSEEPGELLDHGPAQLTLDDQTIYLGWIR